MPRSTGSIAPRTVITIRGPFRAAPCACSSAAGRSVFQFDATDIPYAIVISAAEGHQDRVIVAQHGRWRTECPAPHASPQRRFVGFSRGVLGWFAGDPAGFIVPDDKLFTGSPRPAPVLRETDPDTGWRKPSGIKGEQPAVRKQ